MRLNTNPWFVMHAIFHNVTNSTIAISGSLYDVNENIFEKKHTETSSYELIYVFIQ